MKIIDQGTLFQGQTGTRTANCCFPSIAILDDHSLRVTWRVGSSKDSSDGEIRSSRSIDGGKTWSDPTSPFPAELDNRHGELRYAPIARVSPGRLLAAVVWVDRSEPKLPFFNPETEGLLPTRTLFYESTNGGGAWNLIGEADERPYNGPLLVTGPVFRLPDGRLACSCENNKTYQDKSTWIEAALLKVSSDEGRTWSDHIVGANDPTGRFMYWDSRYAVRNDSSHSIATFWTYNHEAQKDANLHVAFSSDGGKSWSAPSDSGISGQVSVPLFRQNGSLLVFFVDRFRTRSVRMRSIDDFSPDRPLTGRELLIYQQPGAQADPGSQTDSSTYLQDQELWTFGRVDAIEDGIGDIWVVYYAGDRHSTGIRWCRIRQS